MFSCDGKRQSLVLHFHYILKEVNRKQLKSEQKHGERGKRLKSKWKHVERGTRLKSKPEQPYDENNLVNLVRTGWWPISKWHDTVLDRAYLRRDRKISVRISSIWMINFVFNLIIEFLSKKNLIIEFARMEEEELLLVTVVE
jgi:hypothetical protein